MKALLPWLLLSGLAAAEPRLAFVPAGSKADVCRVATEHGKTLQTFANCTDPALSPDGQTLAVTVSTKAGRRLELIDVASGKRTRLPIDAREVFSAVWSPGGDWIAFNLLRAHWSTALVHADGTGLRVLQEEPAAKEDIFLTGWDLRTGAPLLQDLNTLWEVKPDGTTAWHRPLAALIGTASIASDCRFWIAPDGDTLIGSVEVDQDEIAHLDGPSSYLVRASLATGQHERLTPKGMSAQEPVLTPDGVAVVFTGFVAKDVKPGKGDGYALKTRIYRLTLDGGKLETLVENATQPTQSR